MNRYNLKILSEKEDKAQQQVTIRNKFAGLENSEDSGDFNRAWESTRQNIKKV
jgi:hypothetical protein